MCVLKGFQSVRSGSISAESHGQGHSSSPCNPLSVRSPADYGVQCLLSECPHRSSEVVHAAPDHVGVPRERLHECSVSIGYR